MPTGAESPSPTVPLLSYGRERSPRLKWWIKRLGLMLWILTALALAWEKWGVMIRVRVGLYLATQGALKHAEPPERVVYESDPPEVDRLLTMPGYKDVTGPRNGSSVAIYTGFDQRVSDMEVARQLAHHYFWILYPQPKPDPNTIPDFTDAPDFLSTQPDEVFYVYCGKRSAGSESERVVVVAAHYYATSQSVELIPWAEHVDWRPLVKAGASSCVLTTPDKSLLRLFAGQPDPADASKFTLRYVTSIGEGLIVGTVAADGSVDLRIVSGPILPPSPKPLPDLLKVPGQ